MKDGYRGNLSVQQHASELFNITFLSV